MGLGVARYCTDVEIVCELVVGFVIAPGGSVPPIGGGWWLYHSFSAQFTMLEAPCPLAHSANRELNELPSAGLMSAPPRENVSQMKNTPKLSSKTASMRRRRRLLRRPRRRRRLPSRDEDPVAPQSAVGVD